MFYLITKTLTQSLHCQSHHNEVLLNYIPGSVTRYLLFTHRYDLNPSIKYLARLQNVCNTSSAGRRGGSSSSSIINIDIPSVSVPVVRVPNVRIPDVSIPVVPRMRTPSVFIPDVPVPQGIITC